MKSNRVQEAASGIARGGGVRAKVRIRGPRNETWLRLLEKIDRAEVVSAVRGLLKDANGSAENVAAFLDVDVHFLARFLSPRELEGPVKGPLPKYRTPRTVDAILPIFGALGGHGSGRDGPIGAWRISDLLSDPDPRVRAATEEAFKVFLRDCRTIGECADKLGVTRMTLWAWRRDYPKIDPIIREKENAVRRSSVKLKVNGRRRLTLDEGISLMRPHLPGTATEIADAIRESRERPSPFAKDDHGVTPTARELSFYVGKPGSDGFMVVRSTERRRDKVVKIWAMVDTRDGRRLDQRPRRKELACSLCGGSGHNRRKCLKGNSDAEKKTELDPSSKLGRLRGRAGAPPQPHPKERRPALR